MAAKSKKLVAAFDIIINASENQVSPLVLKAGHPIDEGKYAEFIDGWKARELLVEQDTDAEVKEGYLDSTLQGDVGQTDPSLLEKGVAPAQLNKAGDKVVEPGLDKDGKDATKEAPKPAGK
jgi:hypothetical protein